MPFQGIMRLRGAELKRRVEAGQIGDVILMHQTSRWSIAEDWYSSGKPGWFADPKQVPGGAFIDEGIYWIDFFRWLSAGDVTQVEAKIGNLVHKDLAVEDWGMATFTFSDGIIATLEAAWTINAPLKPRTGYLITLVATEEDAVGEPTQGEIVDQWFRSPGRAVLTAGASDWVFERQAEAPPFAPPAPFPLAHLIDCLDNGTMPIASIQDARSSFV